MQNIVNINFGLIQVEDGQLFPSVFRLNAFCSNLNITLNYTLTSIQESQNYFQQASVFVKTGNGVEEANFSNNIVRVICLIFKC